jgi:hypothetical protein
VTNAGERVLELRALMSAVDAPTSWDLRCKMREKLVAFLKESYQESLPRTQAELIKEEVPENGIPRILLIRTNGSKW